MKLYKTKKMTLKVAGCKECPNKMVVSYDNTGDGIRGFAVVCGAICYYGEDDNGNDVVFFPTVYKLGSQRNWLQGCPLPDVPEVGNETV